jgi:hypothetical protein
MARVASMSRTRQDATVASLCREGEDSVRSGLFAMALALAGASATADCLAQSHRLIDPAGGNAAHAGTGALGGPARGGGPTPSGMRFPIIPAGAMARPSATLVRRPPAPAMKVGAGTGPEAATSAVAAATGNGSVTGNRVAGPGPTGQAATAAPTPPPRTGEPRPSKPILAESRPAGAPARGSDRSPQVRERQQPSKTSGGAKNNPLNQGGGIEPGTANRQIPERTDGPTVR